MERTHAEADEEDDLRLAAAQLRNAHSLAGHLFRRKVSPHRRHLSDDDLGKRKWRERGEKGREEKEKCESAREEEKKEKEERGKRGENAEREGEERRTNMKVIKMTMPCTSWHG